ncbi:MAG: hypothetical protein OXI77_07145 [Chloroflexota bacterium]|nr:hypothetical protein [Chloroflexota bacterium]MDE2908106.1 hypothetical protein [Chloroflexota bacterium]
MVRALLILLAAALMIVPASAQSNEAELVLEHGSSVRIAAWDTTETRILTAEGNGSIHIWSTEDGERLLTYHEGGTAATQAGWALADTAVLSAEESGAVLLSDASDGSTIYAWQLEGLPLALELNADGTAAMAFTRAGMGAVLSLDDGAMARRFEAPMEIGGAAWSADETEVRAWSEDGRIIVWDVETGDERNLSLPHRGMVLGLQWNKDDTRLLAWFTNGGVQVYEMDGDSVGGRAISGVRHHSFVKRAIWSRDESMVMSWAGDDTAHIWSVDGARSQRVLRHDDWVIGARWDDLEARVLSWSHIYVYLWDEDAPRRLRHRNLVNGAAWNHDGARILSWSWDGTARIWRA